MNPPKKIKQLAKASKGLDKACCSGASVVGALGATLTFTSSLCGSVLKSGSIMGAAGHMGRCYRRASHAVVWRACGRTQRFITTNIVCIKLHELALLAPTYMRVARMPLTSWLAVFVGRALQSACVQGNMSWRTPAGSVPHVSLQRMSCALHGHQQCMPPVKLPSCVCAGQRDHRGPEVAVQPVRREDRLVRGRRRPVRPEGRRWVHQAAGVALHRCRLGVCISAALLAETIFIHDSFLQVRAHSVCKWACLLAG